MRRSFRLLLLALSFVTIAIVVGARAARPVAEPALGFVAKVVCSDVFVGGATPAQALSDLPDEPIARLVRTRVDLRTRSVQASVPLLARRTAAHDPESGCTLADEVREHIGIGERGGRRLLRAEPEWRSVHDDPAIDAAVLDSVMEDAFAEPDNGSATRRTRAIVVVHDGRIIAERYAPGYSAGNRFTGWSMTKSVMNALVGILVAEGRLSLSDSALRPEWQRVDDPRRAITLDDLLRMSSGLAFDESYTPTGGATRMLFASDDAAAVAAQSELLYEPGERFAYSSATTNIISSVVRARIGSDADYRSFPRVALFERIGMHSAVMESDPSGTLVGSSFMYATARDWARFGQLFLNDGVWNGERILPEGWVEYSTTPAPSARRGEYGAHWWLNAGATADSARRMWPLLPRDTYSASGFQGQYVMIVPSYHLVVVRLGVTPDDRAWDQERFVAGVIRALRPSVDTAPQLAS